MIPGIKNLCLGHSSTLHNGKSKFIRSVSNKAIITFSHLKVSCLENLADGVCGVWIQILFIFKTNSYAFYLQRLERSKAQELVRFISEFETDQAI